MNLLDILIPKVPPKDYLIRRSLAFPGRFLLYDRRAMLVLRHFESIEEAHEYILENNLDGQVEEYYES